MVDSQDLWEASGAPKSYPKVLAKACLDEFVYAIHLKGVGEIAFTSASVENEEWITLNGVSGGERLIGPHYKRCATFDRGLTVRLDSILWVADSPWGT